MNTVSSLIANASADNLLDTLSPDDYVSALSDIIPALADEFNSVQIVISRSNIPAFCKTLRYGARERALIDAGIPEDDKPEIRAAIDISSFDLPRRLEAYVATYPSVKIELNHDMALKISEDLARGRKMLDAPDTETNT